MSLNKLPSGDRSLETLAQEIKLDKELIKKVGLLSQQEKEQAQNLADNKNAIQGIISSGVSIQSLPVLHLQALIFAQENADNAKDHEKIDLDKKNLVHSKEMQELKLNEDLEKQKKIKELQEQLLGEEKPTSATKFVNSKLTDTTKTNLNKTPRETIKTNRDYHTTNEGEKPQGYDQFLAIMQQASDDFMKYLSERNAQEEQNKNQTNSQQGIEQTNVNDWKVSDLNRTIEKDPLMAFHVLGLLVQGSEENSVGATLASAIRNALTIHSSLNGAIIRKPGAKKGLPNNLPLAQKQELQAKCLYKIIQGGAQDSDLQKKLYKDFINAFDKVTDGKVINTIKGIKSDMSQEIQIINKQNTFLRKKSQQTSKQDIIDAIDAIVDKTDSMKKDFDFIKTALKHSEVKKVLDRMDSCGWGITKMLNSGTLVLKRQEQYEAKIKMLVRS